MIKISTYSISYKEFSNLFTPLPAPDINDAASFRLLQGFDQIRTFIFNFLYQIGDIFPVETGSENIFFFESQFLHNIFYHHWRCRCRKRKERDIIRYKIPEGGNFEIRRPEVITPL